MRFELYKILDPQYVDDLRQGNLYMNPLDYFRSIEKNVAKGDPQEGTCGTIHKNQMRQLGLPMNPEFLDMIHENVTLINHYYGYNHLFCLYRLLIDDKNKLIWAPNKALSQFYDADEGSRVVIRIKDTEDFLTRLDKGIQDQIEKCSIEYGIYGNVIYSDARVNADGLGTRSAFHKAPRYAYQNEWRLCTLGYALNKDPYYLSIGDLSDITEVVPFDQFLDRTEETYPGYEIQFDNPPEISSAYSMRGSINAVNQLMFSYADPPAKRLVRSDRGQADWHYSQYLHLVGKTNEVDEYLEVRMKEDKDLEHLELLEDHRVASDYWVGATDAYYYFISEAPQVIKTDPDRFFSRLYTMLMDNREPADAARLYLRASMDFELGNGSRQVMYADSLFALGFFDKTVVLYSRMKESNHDPILDYNLAVSYLHTLDLDKADGHLGAFERQFSSSPFVRKKVAQLRTLVDCFYHEKPLEMEPQNHPFQTLVWNNDLEQILEDQAIKVLLLGIDSLYQLERAQKWDLIDRFREIIVCPLTVGRIMELYEQSGDQAFFNIIICLVNAPNVRVESPELASYLFIDTKNRDLMEYVKMELAYYLDQKGGVRS